MINFIKLAINYSGRYSYDDASNEEMAILGHFLATDVGCNISSFSIPTYQDWAADDSFGMGVSGNLTFIEKENNFILLSDLYAEENAIELRMTRHQFIKLLDDWEEKVCKTKPKEVVIKYENDEYTIETSD